jgi:hypothetical protein
MSPSPQFLAGPLACLILAASPALLTAEDVKVPPVKVVTGYSPTDASFKDGDVPALATNDAGAKAFFKVISGKADESCGVLDVIHDGKGPESEDDPEHNFFFAIGEKGGRLTADIGKVIALKGVASYSWHGGPRAPQIYKLYAADGTAANFNAAPGSAIDPATVGWTLITGVDTHDKGGAGQHAVSIGTESGEPLGKFRYLLFDIATNDEPNDQGNTFYSEIDIFDADGPEPARYEHLPRKVEKFTSKDGKLHFTIDSTEAPDLADWTKKNMLPVMEEWYPKIAQIIPVEGYTPPDTINFTLKQATNLPGYAQGVPAFASGNSVTLNAKFMRDQASGEAVGAAVHEIVHVVQFGSPDWSKAGGARPPTWVTEGVADYIRWVLYEPQSHGADVTKKNIDKINYDQSYRVTANFYDFVTKNYDKDLVKQLNLATHNGYSPDLWKEWTGKTAEELNQEWKAYYRKQLGIE